MKVCLNWLQDYVDVSDLSVETIAETLTDIGLEVEGIDERSVCGPSVVVGKIETAIRHPNADTLMLCTVDIGEGDPLQIVCGAPNARAGIHVALAKVGSVLPGDFKIKKSKIRGEVSFGMMCSEKELGISEDHDKIIELSEPLPLGMPVAKALDLENTVFDVNVTPNRADCLGHLGIARDLAARLKRPLTQPDIDVPRQQDVKTQGHVNVTVHNPEVCQRFLALRVEAVAPIPSPDWLQKRLTAAGMRPINLIVDATNYAMLEFGQPIHAYDERDLAGAHIHVRFAKTDEAIETLDGVTRQLQEDDLLICDDGGPIGVAGVMGGANSEVKSDTKNIVIEVAHFSPISIRQTAKRLGLSTESSHRFERGTDLNAVKKVALRVAKLISLGSTAAGLPQPQVAIDEVDCYPDNASLRKIALRKSRARSLLALKDLDLQTIEDHLARLGLKLLDHNADRQVFEIPSWRGDLEREIDLIEEVGRMAGYDKIPYQLPTMNIRPTPEDDFIDYCEDARVAMGVSGFRETISFPFLSMKEAALLRIGKGHPLFPTLELANPLSEEYRFMHTTLIPVLIRAVVSNRHHGEPGARLFECGRGYYNFDANWCSKTTSFATLARAGRHLSTKAKDQKERPTERHLLAAIIDAPFFEKGWQTPRTLPDFYHGKAVLQKILKALGVAGVTLSSIDVEDLPFLHPGASAAVFARSHFAGFIGEVHPECVTNFGLEADQAPIILELDLERLFEASNQTAKVKAVFQRFPPLTRDLAFLVDRSVTHGDIQASLQKLKKKKFLHRFELFDVYDGDNIPDGKKSLAYTFFFQSPDRTLTDREVEHEIGTIVGWLGDSLGASQR